MSRSLARSTLALGVGLLGLVLSSARSSGEAEGVADPATSASDTQSPDAAPFVGNIELKSRLDTPGKLAIAGERLHGALLRRFYIAHEYQTIWDNHPLEAKRLRNVISRAADHGLDPDLFHSSALGERSTMLSAVDRDLLLSDAFLSYADALSRGAMPIENRADDEDLTPEPVDVVAVLDTAMADPEPARIIEALAPSSPEYRTMRRAYAEFRAIAAANQAVRSARGSGKKWQWQKSGRC